MNILMIRQYIQAWLTCHMLNITNMGHCSLSLNERAFADKSHITPDDHAWLVFLNKPMLIEQSIKNTTNPFPWCKPDDPCRNLSDMEILKSKINLEPSLLNDKEKELFYQVIHNNKDIFSMWDEIGTCPQIQVHLKLRDETPFFVRPSPIGKEQKQIIKREMDRLVRLGIIKKGLTGYSSPVLLVKRKQQNLYCVCSDFRAFK